MSLEVKVHNLVTDEYTRTLHLPASIFDVRTNVSMIHQVVVGQLAAARQGTHQTKTRGEVRGGGRKPYRQKGTGRARQGSSRAPQFAGGGVVHGPRPREYAQRTPKKMKRGALQGALSDRARNGRIHVIDQFIDGDRPSAKQAAINLASIDSDATKLLVILERSDELNWKSMRNLAGVHLLEPGQLNTYDVLKCDDVIFSDRALWDFTGGLVDYENAVGLIVDDPLHGAPNVAGSGRAVDTPHGRSLGIPSKYSTNLVDLDDLRGKVLNMGDVIVHDREPDRHAMAITAADFEAVVLQQFTDMVATSWPSSMPVAAAIEELVGYGNHRGGQTDYFADLADGSTVEFSKSTRAVAAALADLADRIVELHLQTSTETIVWRLPLSDEREPRFVVYEPNARAELIMPLLERTTHHVLLEAVRDALGPAGWVVAALGPARKKA